MLNPAIDYRQALVAIGFTRRPANAIAYSAEELRALTLAATDPRAQLAMHSDKRILSDADGNFLMYAERGKFSILLRDVMSPQHCREEHRGALLRSWLDQAKERGLRPIVYQATACLLDRLSELGLDYKAYKLGEEALVDLRAFSLEGGDFKALRQNIRKSAASGLHFELHASASEDLVASASAISTQWLQAKSATEKGFSIAPFNALALRGMPLACVYQDGELMAFASVHLGAGCEQMAIDLMRHGNDAPRGCMDLLFVRLMEWGKAQGYQDFNLGMSPLVNVQDDEIAHKGTWSALAGKIAAHGESHYNFKGLRRFKEKWQPEWHSRYLLVPHRRHAASAMMACTLQISGGKRALLKI